MRCEAAELAVSTAMDAADPLPTDAVDHVRTCARCRGFEDGSRRLRQTVRLVPAPAVPDLTPLIMARIERAEGIATAETTPAGTRRRVPRRHAAGRLRRAVAAALVAGLAFGFVVARTGLLPSQGPAQALASQVPRELVRAAVALRGYRATFDVLERDWTPRVPVRTFVATVAFRAPESFRVDVTDTTRYPSGTWPHNDLSLVTDGATWRATGPAACPPADLPACAGQPSTAHVVTGRPPFDQQTSMPTDVIVPMTVLAAQDRVSVIGTGVVEGHPAVEVRLPYEEAAPLLRYVQFLGSWRPFFPQDRVQLWLDRATWFPLRTAVYPAPGPERALWAVQNGLPHESPGRAAFVATARSLSTAIPDAATFAPATVSAGSPVADRSDEGFRDLSAPSAPGWVRPADTSGLALIRYGRFAPNAQRPYEESIAAYGRGLAWLTVTRVTRWASQQLFGVDGFAEEVSLPGGKGTAYYEPATALAPRRLAMHTGAGELLVATNLPIAALDRAAASLPVTGEPEPAAWHVHRWPGGEVVDGLSPADAIRRVPFQVEMPSALGSGYEPAAAELTTTDGETVITIVFRRPAAQLDGMGLRLSEAAGQTLPPPTDPAEEEVRIGGVLGRWSPDRQLLEWVSGGVYHSLSGPDFGLSELLRVAASLRPVSPR